MNDLISRQQAIDALKTDMASLDHIIKGMSAYDVRLDAYVSQRNQVDCDIDTISNLPPAQPERKTGRWIPVTNGRGGHQCDRCGSYAPSYQSGTEWLSNFCPECNADMRGKEHE